MAKTIVEIDPVTRISGLLSIKAEIQDGVIVNAESGGMQYRGINRMLQGRPPLDAIRLTSRTCGICSVAHALTSSMALEQALGVEPDLNGKFVRALAHGFDTIQNNIRQIYQLVVPDYVDIAGISPLYTTVPDETDFRLPAALSEQFIKHYQASIPYSRSAHKATATIVGKAPHNHGIFIGGVTTNFDIDMFSIAQAILHDVTEFVRNVMIPDVLLLMEHYPEYRQLGRSVGNYMSYGYFAFLPENFWVTKPGVMLDGALSAVDTNSIAESIRYTWLNSDTDPRKPLDEPPTLNYAKPGAYTWVEAPRYSGKTIETGPMAGLIISGNHDGDTGALERVLARARITLMICEKMQAILDNISLQPGNQQKWQVPQGGEGYAMTDAARGGLGHWIKIENQQISRYSILPPSNWNMSPLSDDGQHGACEQSLIGTPIADEKKAKVIIGRIVRSFDPCLNCAAHVVSDRGAPFAFQIV